MLTPPDVLDDILQPILPECRFDVRSQYGETVDFMYGGGDVAPVGVREIRTPCPGTRRRRCRTRTPMPAGSQTPLSTRLLDPCPVQDQFLDTARRRPSSRRIGGKRTRACHSVSVTAYMEPFRVRLNGAT